jgi:hypothetical protein
MRMLRWGLAGLLIGAAAGFAAGLLRPRAAHVYDPRAGLAEPDR